MDMILKPIEAGEFVSVSEILLAPNPRVSKGMVVVEGRRQ